MVFRSTRCHCNRLIFINEHEKSAGWCMVKMMYFAGRLGLSVSARWLRNIDQEISRQFVLVNVDIDHNWGFAHAGNKCWVSIHRTHNESYTQETINIINQGKIVDCIVLFWRQSGWLSIPVKMAKTFTLHSIRDEIWAAYSWLKSTVEFCLLPLETIARVCVHDRITK